MIELAVYVKKKWHIHLGVANIIHPQSSKNIQGTDKKVLFKLFFLALGDVESIRKREIDRRKSILTIVSVRLLK